MKRSAEEILKDIRECKRVVTEKNTELLFLKQELTENKEIIARQLALWDIPAEIQEKYKIDGLVVEYDDNVDSESVGAGTAVIDKEAYTFSITLNGEEYTFTASRWTGLGWECYDFCDISYLTEEENRWDFVMKENENYLDSKTENAAVAASIVSFAFYAIIEEGKDYAVGDAIVHFGEHIIKQKEKNV